jgi:Alpha-kinase family
MVAQRSEWSLMQALSHFSYHSTDGKYLLCDLQGGFYSASSSNSTNIVLTDPVVNSTDACFGASDLGSARASTHSSCGLSATSTAAATGRSRQRTPPASL